MTEIELKNRFKQWAINVVLFLRKLPNEEVFKVITHQLTKSSTSSAANYRAVCRGKSSADFINKLKIVEEELDESLFWLEFIVGVESKFREPIIPLYKEGDELLAIIVASIKTMRGKGGGNPKS
jgi:four helix bundle protein